MERFGLRHEHVADQIGMVEHVHVRAGHIDVRDVAVLRHLKEKAHRVLAEDAKEAYIQGQFGTRGERRRSIHDINLLSQG
jgi:hypothetical protein